MITYWISFENQASEEWLGLVIVDADDIHLDEDSGEAFITRLRRKGLTPPDGDRWNVQFQKLPMDTQYPAATQEPADYRQFSNGSARRRDDQSPWG